MNLKTRLFHVLAFIVGVAALAATILSKLPKYAAVGAGLALFVADAEKISPALVAAVKKMFPFLVFVALLVLAASSVVSCATLSSLKNCEPTKAGAVQIVADLSLNNWEALLEKLAIDEGVCAVNNVVAEFVTTHAPTAAALTSAKAADSPALVHGRAWLAKHQGSAMVCRAARPV